MTQEEKLRQARYRGLVERLSWYKRDLAERLAATRRLFKQRVYAVDIHTHSNYSDGRCTIEDIRAYIRNAGLDFFFVTDHDSIRQKRVTHKITEASWGQEPGIGPHHVGLLCGSRVFRPRHDTVSADFERARKIAPFVWIPHPVGWYPNNWYSDEAIEILWTFGIEFAIEVINGAHKVVRAYDAFDAKAVRVWDQLLCDGRKISALGGSDAHVPEDIGNVWTGVFAARRTAPSIIKALNAGHCFASEASLMTFSCSSQPMGSTVRKKKGAKLDLHFRIADSAGIASIRIVSQGRIVKDVHTKGRTVVESTLTQKAGANPIYYRLESIATDDRRAFSTPIYVEPTR